MKGKIKVLGHEINIKPNTASAAGEITKTRVIEEAETLSKYKRSKESLEARIVEEEQWYKLQYWDYIRKKENKDEDPEPVTGHIFKIIADKHADAMDNFPEPNLLAREQDDEKEALNLTKVIPKVLEENEFRTAYDDAWWYKIKHGFSIYGTFLNNELADGLGDIDIKKLDALNCFWQSGITDIQQSRRFYIVDLVDDDLILQDFPHIDNITQSKIIDIKQYTHDDTVDITGKSVVVDCYYKLRNSEGKKVLHLLKFVGEQKLYCSEEDEQYAERGLYDHGLFPVDFDVLFPEEGTPTGFGYIAVARNPQMYIDKLDQIITKNALMSGKKRWIIRDNAGINEKEFLDWSKDLIHSTGNLNEDNLREFQVSPIESFVVEHRQNKIQEIKEISGDRDFQTGGTAGGVTAASAIAMLQEAGNKLSRDMIQRSYACYAKTVYKCIELVRQFYTESRNFRIDGPDGKNEYIKYNNAGIQDQQLQPAFEDDEPKVRRPVFDIRVKPERANPFSRIAQNELAKEMYGAGFFDPARADQALIAMEIMSFEGKEKIVQMVSANKTLYDQLQQTAQQMTEMKGTMDKMAMIIQQLSGKNLAGKEVIPPTPDKVQAGMEGAV